MNNCTNASFPSMHWQKTNKQKKPNQDKKQKQTKPWTPMSLSRLSSALHMLRTKRGSFYILFTDSDTELRDIKLSIFLIELVHLRSLGNFLRNCFFVCLPAQILFKVSCWLYFAVSPSPTCQMYKGCYTHMYIHRGCCLARLSISA